MNQPSGFNKQSAFGNQEPTPSQKPSAFVQQHSAFGAAAQPSGSSSPFGGAAKSSGTGKSAFAAQQSPFGSAATQCSGFSSAFTPSAAPKSAFGVQQSAFGVQQSAFGGGAAAPPSASDNATKAPKSAFGAPTKTSEAPKSAFGSAAPAAQATNTPQKQSSKPKSEAPKLSQGNPFARLDEDKSKASSAVLGKEPAAAAQESNTKTAFMFQTQAAAPAAESSSFKLGASKEAKGSEPSKPAPVFGQPSGSVASGAPPAVPAKAKRTVQDLQRITGLKKQYAEECFLAFGCYEAALASFAQSLPLLPKDYFDAYDTVSKNTRKINEELKIVYQKARELTAGGATSADAWKHFQQSPASLDLNAEATPAAPAAAPSNPTTTTTTGFGFGAKAPTGGFQFGVKAPEASGAAAPAAAATAAPATAGFKGFVGFGEKAPEAAAPTAMNGFTGFVGFGEKAPAAAAAAAAPATPSGAFGGFGAAAAAPPPPQKEEKKPELIYCEPEHFTGPFLDMAGFWETEVAERCALLNLNGGFVEANRDQLLPRLEKWVKRASFYRAPVKYVKIVDRDEEVTRVIIKDADRTFNEPQHREKFVQFLHAMYHEFNAYGQAMSYLAGLCLLVLNEEETATVLRFVSKEYIRGHWAAEAVGFATSAWVVHHFMEERFPDVTHHLMELKFWPDTYLQKILTGLCIHVLPFQELFVFLDAFMEGGMAYLIQFCLSIVEHFQARLLAIKDSMEANKVYEIMRLDSHATTITDVRAVLARAPQMKLGAEASSIDIIRSQMYEEHVLPRLQRAPKMDTFEPCAICEKNRPKWWNDDLGHVCDECMAKHPEEQFEKF